MSDSNRGGSGKPDIRYWIFIVSVVAVGVLALVGIQQLVDRSDASRSAAQYAANTKSQIAAECIIPADYVKCAREIKQVSDANQRDEYDQYSQQTMALWTAVMGAMAVMGVGFSAVGVYLIWRTWEATREAATAGFNANQIAQEIGERQLRAWLKVRPNLKGPMGRKETWGANIAIMVENIGQTPALNVFVDAKMHLLMPDKTTPQVALDEHVPNAKARAAIEPRVNVLPGEVFVREIATFVEPSVWDRLWRGFFDEPEVVRAEDPVQFRLFVTVVAVYQTVFSETLADKVSACAYELRWLSDNNDVSLHPFIDNVKSIPEEQLQLCPSPKSVGVVT